MTKSWLHVYLVESVQKELCTRIYCTTCGAMKFRLGVLKALANSAGKPPKVYFDLDNASELARALAMVHPRSDERKMLEDAARCLIFDIWSVMGGINRVEIERILAGSWGGDVLHQMQEHYKARQAEYRVREECHDPVNVQKRREEKKRLKQEQHEQRMVLQKERNRIWYETHRKPS